MLQNLRHRRRRTRSPRMHCNSTRDVFLGLTVSFLCITLESVYSFFIRIQLIQTRLACPADGSPVKKCRLTRSDPSNLYPGTSVERSLSTCTCVLRTLSIIRTGGLTASLDGRSQERDAVEINVRLCARCLALRVKLPSLTCLDRSQERICVVSLKSTSEVVFGIDERTFWPFYYAAYAVSLGLLCYKTRLIHQSSPYPHPNSSSMT